MYKAKPFLDKNSLLSLHLSYIHSYINYASLAWARTHKTNLRKIHNQQKHVLRIVYNKDRYYHTKELFTSCNLMNVSKLNLLNTSIFMNKVKNGTGPTAFHTTFKIPSHSYPTGFLSVNYTKPKTRLRKSRFRISIRGPTTWNNFVANTEKELESSSLFKSKFKTKLLDFLFFEINAKFIFVLYFLIMSKIRYMTIKLVASFNNYWFWTWWQSHLSFLQVPL